MIKKTVLHVKKDGREFFVIAEPISPAEKVPFIDSKTKVVLEPNEVKYRLTELKHGKKHKLLGFVDNIRLGWPECLKICSPSFSDGRRVMEYLNERIFICDIAYLFD